MLPLSGYELDYNESLWQGDIEKNNNCYAYAINNQIDLNGNIPGTLQPGQYAGIQMTESWLAAPAIEIVDAVESDFYEYSITHDETYIFVPIDRYEVCPEGTYKVALVIAPGIDYHWYRQDSDGLWSHKPGTTPVKRTDDSGNLIIDPQIADRGIYTEFIGYFAIMPLNNYYN